jgi:hypothetical protein
VTGPKLGLSPPILTLPGSATLAGFGRIVIFGSCTCVFILISTQDHRALHGSEEAID